MPPPPGWEPATLVVCPAESQDDTTVDSLSVSGFTSDSNTTNQGLLVNLTMTLRIPVWMTIWMVC